MSLGLVVCIVLLFVVGIVSSQQTTCTSCLGVSSAPTVWCHNNTDVETAGFCDRTGACSSKYPISYSISSMKKCPAAALNTLQRPSCLSCDLATSPAHYWCNVPGASGVCVGNMSDCADTRIVDTYEQCSGYESSNTRYLEDGCLACVTRGMLWVNSTTAGPCIPSLDGWNSSIDVIISDILQCTGYSTDLVAGVQCTECLNRGLQFCMDSASIVNDSQGVCLNKTQTVCFSNYSIADAAHCPASLSNQWPSTYTTCGACTSRNKTWCPHQAAVSPLQGSCVDRTIDCGAVAPPLPIVTFPKCIGASPKNTCRECALNSKSVWCMISQDSNGSTGYCTLGVGYCAADDAAIQSYGFCPAVQDAVSIIVTALLVIACVIILISFSIWFIVRWRLNNKRFAAVELQNQDQRLLTALVPAADNTDV
eukprot:GILK01006790.1.p1 GENE.GILK01006790.1~~GILK01006790.1.p1  ORF type:complete len:423 (+),score=7.19 GILK01006790.1:43-1311(+)